MQVSEALIGRISEEIWSSRLRRRVGRGTGKLVLGGCLVAEALADVSGATVHKVSTEGGYGVVLL